MQQPAGATPSAASFDKKEDLDFYSGCAFWLPVGFEYDNAGVISTAQCNAVHPLPDSARRTMARRYTFRIPEPFCRALPNSGRDEKFSETRHIVFWHNVICSFGLRHHFHFCGHHAHLHVRPPTWSRPLPGGEGMDAAEEDEAAVERRA